MKRLAIGILAHVDSGKTTLAEAMLYRSGQLRKAGRVDHGDAFLDSYALEKERGITIFSKQARMTLPGAEITLLDTPGHADFGAEMERTLQALDYAILVISGTDGVQSHTETLWQLLRRYRIPTILFINKMDLPGPGRQALMENLKKRLSEACVDFGAENAELWEALALCDETLMAGYLEHGALTADQLITAIARRRVFPCYFGFALKMEGIEALLACLEENTRQPQPWEHFAAKVFKISEDEQGGRLTHLKITGGVLKVKELLAMKTASGEALSEKVDQIRLYSGAKFQTVPQAEAGAVCAVTGLSQTYPGQGLGAEEDTGLPMLEPVLTYRVLLPPQADVHAALKALRRMEEEDPELHVMWNEQLGQLHLQLMGQIQLEILQTLLAERFGLQVGFDQGSIVYKETIAAPVEGVGHFEPLRHYAEVHLLLEPLPRGSGLQFASACREDQLEKSWQRLVLTHLEEKAHRGVLTGAEVTDMKITLMSGKAHLKHTEGGDFRQATYRAVRQGLMQAESVLLEPYYAFRLEIPRESVGRAMSDVERMCGSMEAPEPGDEWAVLKGTAPVAAMQNYQQEVTAYTRGRGRLFCRLRGYGPCHNEEEVLGESSYDPELDVENTPDSVFCYHGAGTVIPWYEAASHMHLESCLADERKKQTYVQPAIKEKRERPVPGTAEEEKELEEIFARTYGSPRERTGQDHVCREVFGETGKTKPSAYRPKEKLPEYLLVDGYNVIFAWEELRELARTNIDSARGKLMDILCNYQGFRRCSLILVFDAYRVEGHAEEVVKYHNIHVVYTKEAETADQYIERTVHEMGRKCQVTVATSDGLEQIIIRGQGCAMMSARELREEVDRINREIREDYVEQFPGSRNYLFDCLPEELAEWMREVRLGKKSMEDGRE